MLASPYPDWIVTISRPSIRAACFTVLGGLIVHALGSNASAESLDSAPPEATAQENVQLTKWLHSLQKEAKAHKTAKEFLPIFDHSLERLGTVSMQPEAKKLKEDLRALLLPAYPPVLALSSSWVVGTITPSSEFNPNPMVTCSQNGYSIPFVLVEAPNVPPFYMASIELPVGLATAAKLLPPTNDLEFGPQVWPLETTRRGNWAWKSALFGPMTVAIGEMTFYGKENGRDFSTAAIGEATPLNAISGYQAQKIATALQCTLPTLDQWKAASAERYQPPGVPPRLRGTLWKKQYDYWKDQCHRYQMKTGLLPLGSIPWPDAGSYDSLPHNGDGSNGEPAIAPAGTDDSSLWFRSVTASFTRYGYLYDLKGNVAEFLLEGNRFLAIGGSAISNPTEWDKPIEVAGTKRYSDVGIRLVARTATPEPGKELVKFSERVEKALADAHVATPATP